METKVKLYTLRYDNARAYLAAAAFVAGNIALPQLFHLVPQGGMTWLPIYFFTLIAAYKCGWQVGLLTAVLSPTVNSWLFGMPMPAALPAILTKSALLAAAASYAARKYNKVSIPLLIAVVLFYQATGTLCEWAYTASLQAALQDFRMGLPGMAFQVVAGYLLLRYAARG